MAEVAVPAEAAGERLDRWLAGALGSRARAQRLIEDGLVLVDGAQRSKNHRLRGGETLAVVDEDRPPEPGGEPGDVPYEVAWEDEHLLVVDKPPGVVVHPAPGTRGPTLAEALAARGARGGEPFRPGIVHRLDRDTSGLLVVARSERVLTALRRALQRREMEREYAALVEGCPPARAGTIDAPLGRDRRRRWLQSTDTASPRAAVTHFSVERTFPRFALLAVTLQTGRTHQIRAHLKAIGSPVAGDPDYGTSGLLGLGRQFLHARRLAFEHPVTHEPVDVISPLPGDLEAALLRAERDEP